MSEFRQDLVSGDWVIIAPGRAARPRFLDEKKPERKPLPKSACPFEDLKASGNTPSFALPNEKNWRIVVMPNKYPALDEHAGPSGKEVCSVLYKEGIYSARTGVGSHDLIVTRDHDKNFAAIDAKTAFDVLGIFQKLCSDAAKDPCTVYAVPFCNWGPLAGASVWHPHYQFLSTPIVPAHSAHSLAGAKAYFKKNRRCVRCDMITFERKEKVRVIEENTSMIAVAPYASKYPFEVRIMSKSHESYFYKTSPEVIRDTVKILQSVLRRLKKYVNDPDFNFFIHEAPFDGKPHDYHHWHIEIVPRVSTPAGFEFSTGIYINTVEPEKAAKILRGFKI